MFHFLWGEITVTPLDFCMLTNLPFSSMDLPVEREHSSLELWSLFNPAGAIVTTSLVPLSAIVEGLTDPETTAIPGQLVYLFILYLLSYTIFMDTGSRARITYVSTLRDLERSREYNWGFLVYATLIRYLRVVC